MSNNKQTAVEWLVEKLEKNGDVWENASIRAIQISIDVTEYLDLKRQAKEMEKQQIKGAWLSAWKDSMLEPLEDKYYEPEAEQYYNEEYGKL